MKRYFAIIALLALVSVPCFAATTSVPVTLVIEGYVEITADSAATITITPSSTGGTGSTPIDSPIKFTVKCNVSATVSADTSGLAVQVFGAGHTTTNPVYATVEWASLLTPSTFDAPGASGTCALTATITGAPAYNAGLSVGNLVLTTTP